MKIYIFISLLILSSCGNQKEKNEIPSFEEKELSFKFLKEQYEPSNRWIKEPNNIIMLHETFKSVGYIKLLEHIGWKEDWTIKIDNKRSLKNLIDSLEITYDRNESPMYYKQFWARRVKEGNKEIVYKVIKEIKSITMNEPEIDGATSNLVNDTLEYLAKIEVQDSLNSIEASNFLNYLIETGMHQSAFNVRSGDNFKFEEIEWNSDASKIYEKLNISDTYKKPWIEDNAKY